MNGYISFAVQYAILKSSSLFLSENNFGIQMQLNGGVIILDAIKTVCVSESDVERSLWIRVSKSGL